VDSGGNRFFPLLESLRQGISLLQDHRSCSHYHRTPNPAGRSAHAQLFVAEPGGV